MTPKSDQVFDSPYASDPSHSIISKVSEIFNTRLRQYKSHRIILTLFSMNPSGKVAETVVEYTSELIVKESIPVFFGAFFNERFRPGMMIALT